MANVDGMAATCMFRASGCVRFWYRPVGRVCVRHEDWVDLSTIPEDGMVAVYLALSGHATRQVFTARSVERKILSQ